MFNKECFISECKKLIGLENAHKKIHELLKTQLTDSSKIIEQLGQPKAAGVELLYCADDLTIINFVMTPGMHLHAHNHNMWAIIGIYAGVEENIFYTRVDGTITKKNSKKLSIGDAVILGENVIHSVRNPTSNFTAGIHIYGGNFVERERSQWDMESLIETPYDMETTQQVFTEANQKIYTI
ncbi:MAG: putative metal-dependent enzyme (double-stranded beta helix superfamily) [Cellvibrionaceae bacterium]|jgi:predicted metal-dependent enzyme (double-stranded beta helix superfamily)